MSETCEDIIADLLSFLQDVDGVKTVDRGEHRVPESLDALPAIIILEGEDDVTETTRRGNKRAWDIYFVLMVAGADADSMLYDLATFREQFRIRMAEFRVHMRSWSGTIFEAGRGTPVDAGIGNYVVAQTEAYRVIYAEPPLV